MTACNDTHRNLAQRMRAESPVRERTDRNNALADWQRQHTDLTARLVAIETEIEIDDHVYRLFDLTAGHSRYNGAASQ